MKSIYNMQVYIYVKAYTKLQNNNKTKVERGLLRCLTKHHFFKNKCKNNTEKQHPKNKGKQGCRKQPEKVENKSGYRNK